MRRALIGLALLVCVAPARARSTDTMQITDDGRSMRGTFSPDGSTVAYLSLEKHFTPKGLCYFTGRVHLWDGENSRVSAELGNSKPTAESADRIWNPFGAVHWLHSGRYLVGGGWTGRSLVRVADGALTRVGKYGDWFVMNDAWDLSAAEAVQINRRVHGEEFATIGGRRPGERIRTEDLPSYVPRESDDWEYHDFWRSPRDRNRAFYVGYDKDFFGCACTSGFQKHYLGVADLLTGRLRRLTWGVNYYLSPSWVQWSPDGSSIAYLRQNFNSIDTPITWSTLHIIRPSGAGDRCLAHDVSFYHWISPTEIVAVIGLDWDYAQFANRRQLSIVDVAGGRVRRMTKGDFEHRLCDVYDGRYLVLERPVGASRCQGNLYVIRPL